MIKINQLNFLFNIKEFLLAINQQEHNQHKHNIPSPLMI